jgi:hypothetical protein
MSRILEAVYEADFLDARTGSEGAGAISAAKVDETIMRIR